MASARSTADQSHAELRLPAPGVVGRLIRVALGVGILALLRGLVTGWRSDLWAGHLPLDFGFIVVVCLALAFTPTVFNFAFGLQWGRHTLLGVLSGAVAASAFGYAVEGSVPSSALGIYLWVWFVSFCALLAPAHLLAATLGTPGCEMRSYKHLLVLLRGGDVDAVACPGGIDRFDGIGGSRP